MGEMKFDPKLAAQQMRARMSVPYSINAVADGLDALAAEVGRLRKALEDIAAMRSWAGQRLPQIFDIADAALDTAGKEVQRAE